MSPLFIPGPVEVAEEVLAAQTQPMLAHRSAAFEEIFHRAESNARKVFQTESRVFILPASGTGFQEAAMRNLVRGRVLVCVNGAFSTRWLQVAQTNGKQADALELDWRKPITPDLVAEKVKKHKYDLVAIVHNETSTGLLNPVAEVAMAVHDNSPDTLVAVDAVSSLGGANLEMDAWGLDMVFTSSQKALALPPGLALGAVNERAMARVENVPNRGWYFDFLRLEKHRTTNSTPTTPAVSLVFALDLQLKRILEEGLQERFERHLRLAQHTRAWATGRGFGLYAPQGYRSPTITTVQNELDINLSDLLKYLKQRGMVVASGYGPLKQKTFRIGHMGEIGLDDLQQLLQTINEFLDEGN
ncbi:MAG: alanine--glyoxylate aminotransferase family protein [Anaerolineales bacterium]